MVNYTILESRMTISVIYENEYISMNILEF